MGGDHKCPVCQATFTRPQHVARHMRSHTGDRPYKCQHCGDQFARSDLLSRHINKCHANEKPTTNDANTRREGTASASRATTSKQACDQCVQSSLPCDGCNPCSKCVNRKCRCTFVKFHRQTAALQAYKSLEGIIVPAIKAIPSSGSMIGRKLSILRRGKVTVNDNLEQLFGELQLDGSDMGICDNEVKDSISNDGEIYDSEVEEENQDSEVGGYSSSVASGGWSSASSAASATFKAVGRAVRKGFGRKRLKGTQLNLGKFETEEKMLDSYLPLFPHHSPDANLSEVYDDLCTFSRLDYSFKYEVVKIFTEQIELGETSQLLTSLTQLCFEDMEDISSEIFQHFHVKWRASRSVQIWYPNDSLFDALQKQSLDGGLRQVVHFLNFIVEFIEIDQNSHALLCIPSISDIITGICLRHFIPNAISSVNVVLTAQKAKDTPLFKKCQSVVNLLLRDIDKMDIHDVWISTVQLMESPANQKQNAQRVVNLFERIFERTHCPELNRLLLKLCESCDTLPTSLFVTGVKRLDTEATFGGGFADIYRGSLQDEVVALKRLRIFLNDKERHNLHRRLCREALTWKRLKHENILPFIGVDAESFPNFICMVSPWMYHGTLVSFVAAHHNIVDIDNLLRGVIVGLRYLHTNGVVHGDLRGANILINSHRKPCLADFGLTVFSDSTLATQTSNRNGSVRWMAPELHRPQSVGLEKFVRTFATDIYAFACVCVEIYSGKPPFLDIRQDTAVILRVIKDGRPSRPSGNPGLAMPPGLWSIVIACWRQRPSRRPNISGVLRRFDHDYIGVKKAVLRQTN